MGSQNFLIQKSFPLCRPVVVCVKKPIYCYAPAPLYFRLLVIRNKRREGVSPFRDKARTAHFAPYLLSPPNNFTFSVNMACKAILWHIVQLKGWPFTYIWKIEIEKLQVSSLKCRYREITRAMGWNGTVVGVVWIWANMGLQRIVWKIRGMSWCGADARNGGLSTRPCQSSAWKCTETQRNSLNCTVPEYTELKMTVLHWVLHCVGSIRWAHHPLCPVGCCQLLP